MSSEPEAEIPRRSQRIRYMRASTKKSPSTSPDLSDSTRDSTSTTPDPQASIKKSPTSPPREPRAPYTKPDIYIPSENATPHQRLQHFIHNYVSLPSFLASHLRKFYRPFVHHSKRMVPIIPAALHRQPASGTKIAYAVVFGSTEGVGGIVNVNKEKEALEVCELDEVVTVDDDGNHIYGVRAVNITVVVQKDETDEKRQEWEISVLAQGHDDQGRVVKARVDMDRWDDVAFADIPASPADSAAWSAPSDSGYEDDNNDDDSEEGDEDDSSLEGHGNRELRELKAELNVVFKMERDYSEEEIRAFERVLTWERLVELLKYEARVREGVVGEMEEPLKGMGVSGWGFEMREVGGGGKKYSLFDKFEGKEGEEGVEES